jgi:hypothetical protein
MNKTILTLVTLAFIGLSTTNAQVGIGTTDPEESSALDVEATDKGFLPPRMTEAERDAISNPATGLMVYCTNCGNNGEAQIYNGTSWTNMIGGDASEAPQVPDAPTITNVSAGDGQVDITFDAPTDDGGSTITTYTATSNPGNITGSISQAGSGTITVTGLTNGTAYTFTVTTTNSVGTSSPSSASNSVTPSPPPQVGDYRDGGVVFYVASNPTDLNGDGTPDQGLVCAVEDQSSGAEWGCNGTSISGAGGNGIGSGAGNTSDILADCSQSGIAAEVCNNYTGGGYNDWFLPAGANGGSSFASDRYWSSTEGGNYEAWLQYFSNGLQYGSNKYLASRVRAVRAF